jgi:hypothetical protein
MLKSFWSIITRKRDNSSNLRVDNYFKPRARGVKSVTQAFGKRYESEAKIHPRQHPATCGSCRAYTLRDNKPTPSRPSPASRLAHRPPSWHPCIVRPSRVHFHRFSHLQAPTPTNGVLSGRNIMHHRYRRLLCDGHVHTTHIESAEQISQHIFLNSAASRPCPENG